MHPWSKGLGERNSSPNGNEKDHLGRKGKSWNTGQILTTKPINPNLGKKDFPPNQEDPNQRDGELRNLKRVDTPPSGDKKED